MFMRSGTKIVCAAGSAAVCLVLFAASGRAPDPRAGAVRPATKPIAAAPVAGPSCKPMSPLAIQAEPAGSPDLWNLRLSSTGADRDVVVWMGAPSGSRRLVWQGRLRQGQETRIQASYSPPGGAAEVWASVEPAGEDPALGPGVLGRGLATAAVPGRAAPSRTDAARLIEVPGTGESILEFTGQVQR
jgi:hypothetical protein